MKFYLFTNFGKKKPLTIHNKKGLEGKLMYINSTVYVSTMVGSKDFPSNP
jgi:hypothetical protein